MVNSYQNEVGIARFEMYTAPEVIYQKLSGLNITVDFVCAYMLIGNMNHRKGLFEGCSEFSCSDPFLAYTFWFLMSNVFLVYKEGNHIPGLEVSLRSKGDDESPNDCIERIRTAKRRDMDMRIQELCSMVDLRKQDLYQYFFRSEMQGQSK